MAAKRTQAIRLTISHTEKLELQRAADKAGLPLAAWVRSAALTMARKPEKDGA